MARSLRRKNSDRFSQNVARRRLTIELKVEYSSISHSRFSRKRTTDAVSPKQADLQPPSPARVFPTPHSLLGPKPIVPDPKVPPENGKTILLALPPELRPTIWNSTHRPPSRASIFRHDVPRKKNTKCRLHNVALPYQETRGMRLDLDSSTFVSNATIDTPFAIQSFATLLDTCFKWAFGRIREVTVQCEFLGYLAQQRSGNMTPVPYVLLKEMPDIVHTSYPSI
ncbi:hypothetical protein PSPO01_15098 [Paraphaeosphaeria sporulosa]